MDPAYVHENNGVMAGDVATTLKDPPRAFHHSPVRVVYSPEHARHFIASSRPLEEHEVITMYVTHACTISH